MADQTITPDRPEIVLIAALAEKNRVIGRQGRLPWHLPEDLQRFKRLTMGHPLLMGRKTFESLLKDFGGPLPGRRHLVLSRHRRYPDMANVEVYPDVSAALAAVGNVPRLFIAGGGEVYARFLPQADRLELTLVEGDYEGDTFFPPYEHLIGPVFEMVAVEQRPGFRFVTYRRRPDAPRP